MRRRLTRLLSCAALSALGPTVVWASCAENLTRIQTTLPRAAPDVQTRAAPLVTEAEARLKARDAAGCEAATSQALQFLQLPVLLPIQLSTPMASPQEPARANKPSETAASAQRASTDSRSEASAKANAAPSPPSGAVSPGATSPGAVEAARQSAEPGQAGRQGSQGSQPDTAGQAAEAQSQAPATTQNPTQSTVSNQPQARAGQARASTQPQAASVPQTRQPATTGAPDMPFFLSSRDLIGSEVVDPDNTGRTLGRVANLIIDKVTGQTQYVTLESGGFLGWDRDRVIIPYSILAFSGEWDRPSLRVPASKVENAPQIRDQDVDTLLQDPDWRRAIAQYFGTEMAENSPNAGGNANLQASAEPPGPRPSTSSSPAAPSNPTGWSSDPKAAPGEGATGPTAASGDPAAAVTAAVTQPPTGGRGGPDPAHGKAVAQRACAACHTLNQGGPTRVGPNLFGIAERSIASVSGYNYSNALKTHQGSWDQASLDAFLKNPRGYAPGTYMTFPGIKSDQDRQNVVAYLESLK
jgi:cytochrome c2